MDPKRIWLVTHRRALALGAALLCTLAAGIGTRALANRIGASAAPAHAPLHASHGPVILSGELEGTKLLRGGDGLARFELAIGAIGPKAELAKRVPTDVLVVLDRSGSMEGEKIEHARRAVQELLRGLGSDDRFALVSYASDARIDARLTPITPQSRAALSAQVAGIAATTGTNLSSGLDLGLGSVLAERTPGRAARVFVISDGLVNEGDVSHEGLLARVRRAAAREWVVTSIGVGADFDERLMGALADAGTGNFYYLERARDLAGVFANEFHAAASTVASSVEVVVMPAPGVRLVDAAGYPLETRGGEIVFAPGSLFSNQTRRIWLTFAVAENAAADQALGRIALRYEREGRVETLELPASPKIAWADKPAEVVHALSPAAWERAVVQESYGQLEDKVSEYVRNGERQRALDEIERFEKDAAATNAVVQSAPVAKKLEEARSLRDDVGGAFSGENQAEKRNALSKSKLQSGKDARRAGAKAQAVKP